MQLCHCFPPTHQLWLPKPPNQMWWCNSFAMIPPPTYLLVEENISHVWTTSVQVTSIEAHSLKSQFTWESVTHIVSLDHMLLYVKTKHDVMHIHHKCTYESCCSQYQFETHQDVRSQGYKNVAIPTGWLYPQTNVCETRSPFRQTLPTSEESQIASLASTSTISNDSQTK